MNRSLYRIALSLLGTLFAIGSVGCTTLPSLPLPGSASEQPETAPPTGPMVVVEIRAEDKEPVARAIPLSAEPMFVSDALKLSGASKRFRRMQLAVYRASGQGYNRLNVEYELGKKRVSPEYDYALHEGDRVVVIEDTSTVLDDMLGSTPTAVKTLLR